MRRAVWACLLIGIINGSLLAQSETYIISGTVVDHATHQPLPKVLVQITLVQEGEWSDTGRFISTDSEGRFAFAHVTPGKYTLLAGRQPSNPQLFQGEDGFSTAIAAGPGLDSEHVVFPLSTPGVIAGTVVDEEGEGLKNANVYLYAQRITAGRFATTGIGQQQTKSSGSFRFSRLQPGTYFLAVQALPWYAANNRMGNQEQSVVYPVTYYPDATDVSSASPITVSEGSTAQVQIALHPVSGIRVRVSGIENKPDRNTQVMIAALGPGNQKIMVNPVYTMAEDHEELSGIPPGRYDLSVMAFNNGVGQTAATRSVDLQDGSEIDLNSLEHCSLSGRITFAGGARAPNPLSLSFAQVEGYYSISAPVTDGTFQIAALPAGRYWISSNGGSWFHFQAIDVKGGRFKDGFLEIPDGAKVQLSITASTAKTVLDGVALRDEKPVPGAMVLLLSEDPDRSDLLRRDQSDSDGTFTLRDVPLGRYRIFAIDNGRGLAYAESAVIKPYLASAQAITVDAGKQPPLKVNVQAKLP